MNDSAHRDPEGLPATGSTGPQSFRHLLVGTFASHLGTNISILVFPTFAITYLDASDQQVAGITIAQTLPMVLFSLWVGSRVDRTDRKQLIVVADILSALLSFAAAYWLWQKDLTMSALYMLVATLSFLSIVYNVATQALVPELLGKDRLLWANSRMFATRSTATVLGQFIASKITVIAFGALAMAIDAISHLVRAAFLLPALARPPATPTTHATNETTGQKPGTRGWRSDVHAGLRYMRQQPELIRIIGVTATFNLGGAFILAFFFLFTYNTLGLTPWHLGLAFGIGSIAATAGAMSATRWSHSRNLVRRGKQFFILSCIALWLLLFATVVWPFAILLLYEVIFKFSSAVFTVAMTTKRHEVVATEFQGRIGSIGIVASYMAMLVASVLATLSAAILTPTQGVATGAILSLLSFLWFVNWRDTSRHAGLAGTAPSRAPGEKNHA